MTPLPFYQSYLILLSVPFSVLFPSLPSDCSLSFTFLPFSPPGSHFVLPFFSLSLSVRLYFFSFPLPYLFFIFFFSLGFFFTFCFLFLIFRYHIFFSSLHPSPLVFSFRSVFLILFKHPPILIPNLLFPSFSFHTSSPLPHPLSLSLRNNLISSLNLTLSVCV